MAKHTMQELRQWQALPLDIKVRMTETRIRMWIDEYGQDGVYVSFSGGKDSTVLLDIVRNRMGYKDIPAVFVDVPTQYTELRDFAKTWDNVEIIKPKISFMQVCEKYGFPLISKEVSECVQGARRYLMKIQKEETDGNIPYAQFFRNLQEQGNIENSVDLANLLEERRRDNKGGQNQRLAQVLGWYTKENTIQANIPEQDRSMYSQEKWKFFLEAPFEISNKCCKIMKKDPLHNYAKETGKRPMTAQMADESRLRTQKWLQNGCNGFDMKEPISNPMSFWVENDVLEYIVKYNLPICSVYGDIVRDYGEQIDGQISLVEEKPKYKTTGCDRTGCMLCGFGCHLEKSPNRFEMLKETHPKMYNLLDICKNNGVTFREAIEWTNEHGDLNIKL